MSARKPSNWIISDKAIFAMRCALAGLWLYEGLWLKVVCRDPHELEIVRSALGRLGVPAMPAMLFIGIGETLLALTILSGLRMRAVAWFQLAALLAMHSTATMFGGLANPVDLWVHSLPTYACIIGLIAVKNE